MTSMAELLKKKVKSNSIIKVGGAFDVMSAMLVEKHDFDAIWVGGFGVSAVRALPDASIISMTELLDVSRNIANRCKIPVLVDCDTGYGGPSNVAYTVKKFEDAGIAGISIEDKHFPKQNSLFDDGKQDLISEKDFAAKIISAKDAKKDPNFMIIARTEALIANLGMNEAIRRANSYEKAGADAIFIHSKKNSPYEIFEFCDLWKGNIPIVVVPTAYPTVTLDELKSHNIKIVIYAHQSFLASYSAISKVLEELSNTKSISQIQTPMTSMDEIFRFQGLKELREKEKKLEEKIKKLGYDN